MTAEFFHRVQSAPWYKKFMAPVIDTVFSEAPSGFVLDVGSGPGMLLRAIQQRGRHKLMGWDTNADMIDKARDLSGGSSLQFMVPQKTDYEAMYRCCDAVTLCSVLFLQKEPLTLLQEALSMIKKSGVLIILTPSGQMGPFPWDILRTPWANRSFWLWFFLTRNRARIWNREQIIKEYARQHGLNYSKKPVFDGRAVLEILQYLPG